MTEEGLLGFSSLVPILTGILKSFRSLSLTSSSGFTPFPLRPHPLPVLQLTQGSIQVLEDSAAVVQADIDLLLQEGGPGLQQGQAPAKTRSPAHPVSGSCPHTGSACYILALFREPGNLKAGKKQRKQLVQP